MRVTAVVLSHAFVKIAFVLEDCLFQHSRQHFPPAICPDNTFFHYRQVFTYKTANFDTK